MRPHNSSHQGQVTMQNANSPAALRRSSRVPINVPILVTSLEPGTRFSEVCETLVVNAHGCAMRSPVKLDAGVLLHFHSKEGRETTAKVINCQPLTSDRSAWQLAARLDRPENFWGLSSCPPDWAQLPAPAAPTNGKVPSKLAAKTVQPVDQGANAVSPSLKAMFDKIQKQVSDEHLRSMISELMHPLLGDMADLKEKLGRMGRSKFEVSLSQIPPELEDQMEQRLQNNLGPRVLEQTRRWRPIKRVSIAKSLNSTTASQSLTNPQAVSRPASTSGLARWRVTPWATSASRWRARSTKP